MSPAPLITEAQLADAWGVELKKLQRMRRERGWPCVRLHRNDVRFTEAQVEQIVAMQSTTPQAKADDVVLQLVGDLKIPGQTARSAARQRSEGASA